jgi:hypothetical protein
MNVLCRKCLKTFFSNKSFLSGGTNDLGHGSSAQRIFHESLKPIQTEVE